MSGLILLVSYPKSGNTWVRALLSSIYAPGGRVDINRLGIKNIADRSAIASLSGVSTADFSEDEEYRIRFRAFQDLARGENVLFKTHEAMLPRSNPPMLPFPEHAIRSVVYIVRDPRDVAASFANHLGVTIDAAIGIMANSNYYLEPQRHGRRPQISQLLSTWSAHALSWIDRPRLNAYVMRYDDMHADPKRCFSNLLKFVGINAPTEVLVRAIKATRFSNLRAQEQEEGFVERPSVTKAFFRRGTVNGWIDTLTREQSDRIVAEHRVVMQRLGYLATGPTPIGIDHAIAYPMPANTVIGSKVD
jgi:aryl sulfotransferase